MMKKLLLFNSIALFLGLATVYDASAQANPIAKPDKSDSIIIEQMPSYPGGDKALYAFVNENLKYPEEALEEGIEGRVYVSFVVDKTGQVTKIAIDKSLGKPFDEEAMRVIGLLKGFEPARINGVPANYRYVMPIKFGLAGPGLINGKIPPINANKIKTIDP